MKTIYKYPVSLREDLIHSLPAGARFVHVDQDPAEGTGSETFAVWAEVNPDGALEDRWRFSVHGTGGQVQGTYVGSVRASPFMWHVFAEKL